MPFKSERPGPGFEEGGDERHGSWSFVRTDQISSNKGNEDFVDRKYPGKDHPWYWTSCAPKAPGSA